MIVPRLAGSPPATNTYIHAGHRNLISQGYYPTDNDVYERGYDVDEDDVRQYSYDWG